MRCTTREHVSRAVAVLLVVAVALVAPLGSSPARAETGALTTISGHVTLANGSPDTGRKVTAAGGGVTSTTTTDETGYYSVQAVDGGSTKLTIDNPLFGFSGDVTVSGPMTEDLHYPAFTSSTVHVVDQDGLPLAGARFDVDYHYVTITLSDGTQLTGLAPSGGGVTGDDGSGTMLNWPGTPVLVTASVTVDGDSFSGSATLDNTDGGTVTVPITLTKVLRTTLSGTYLTRDGTPFVGQDVTATSSRLSTSTTTDSAGHYSLEVIDGTQSTLLFGHPLSGFRGDVHVSGPTVEDFQYPPDVTSTAFVVDQNGAPLPSVNVQGAPRAVTHTQPDGTVFTGLGWGGAKALTDAAGSATLYITPGAPISLSATVTVDGQTFTGTTVLEEPYAAEVTIVIDVTPTRYTTLSGTITLADGSPAEGREVQASGTGVLSSTTTDASGSYSLQVADDTSPTLSIGRIPLDLHAAVPVSGPTTQDVQFPELTSATVHVRDSRNAPLPGVDVRPELREVSFTTHGRTFTGWSSGQGGTTDADGKAAVLNWPGGSQEFTASVTGDGTTRTGSAVITDTSVSGGEATIVLPGLPAPPGAPQASDAGGSAAS